MFSLEEKRLRDNSLLPIAAKGEGQEKVVRPFSGLCSCKRGNGHTLDTNGKTQLNIAKKKKKNQYQGG